MRGPVPPIQVYNHIGSHTLGEKAGNHFNQPYRGTEGVQHLSDLPIPMHRYRLCVS